MAEKIPGWLEKVLLPQIGELKAEIRLVNARIDGVGEKIDQVDKRLGMKIEESNLRLAIKIDELDKRLAMTQRLAVVEEQIKELRANT